MERASAGLAFLDVYATHKERESSANEIHEQLDLVRSVGTLC